MWPREAALQTGPGVPCPAGRGLTHVGRDDDEGPQVRPPQVPGHVVEIGLEAPQQLCRAGLAPLDLLPGGPGGRGQEGAARPDDILPGQTDGQAVLSSRETGPGLWGAFRTRLGPDGQRWGETLGSNLYGWGSLAGLHPKMPRGEGRQRRPPDTSATPPHQESQAWGPWPLLSPQGRPVRSGSGDAPSPNTVDERGAGWRGLGGATTQAEGRMRNFCLQTLRNGNKTPLAQTLRPGLKCR